MVSLLQQEAKQLILPTVVSMEVAIAVWEANKDFCWQRETVIAMFYEKAVGSYLTNAGVMREEGMVHHPCQCEPAACGWSSLASPLGLATTIVMSGMVQLTWLCV